MPPIYILHIAAGLLGLASGYVALFSVKGLPIHRKAGVVFVWTMLPMALFGMIMAVVFDKAPRINLTIGVLTIYLVTTSFSAVSKRYAGSAALNVGGLMVVLAVVIADLYFGFSAAAAGNAGASFFFIFGLIGILAAMGDLRVIRLGPLTGPRRLARHLWRMCLALAVGSMAFFIGQSKVFPEPIRIMPLLAAPMLIVITTMFVWLWRVRLKHVYARVATRAQILEQA